MERQLTTFEEYCRMSPKQQGYVAYMEAAWPGSELKGHDDNPYSAGSKESAEWKHGQALAVQEAQDSEE